ncbi:MAG: 16S rRNA (guanine(966)-N(2))-methyltransferase RsmD [Proteobacteria bacterium]|nr:16S rRNA (guanine(966)-N(2))-methyltransferase RsmD [Pseudomonadota bacterium]
MAFRPATSVRIIGGNWNGRKIRIPTTVQLRPSGDRLRESLFSCLGGTLNGLHCLDLFAGCGALGLCAASRGAAHTTFVEKHRATAAALQQLIDELAATAIATVKATSARQFLSTCSLQKLPPAKKFDVVFLDPPFADYNSDCAWAELLATLRPHLKNNARVYCESTRHFSLPDAWQQQTARRTGNVYWQILNPLSHD